MLTSLTVFVRRIGEEHGKTFARFCIVGVLNTTIDMAAYFALTQFLGLAHSLVAAKTISYLIATLNSFYFNHTWTFQREEAITAHKVDATVGLGIFINAGIYWFVLHVLHMHEIASLLVATGGTVIWGFAWSRFLVFKI